MHIVVIFIGIGWYDCSESALSPSKKYVRPHKKMCGHTYFCVSSLCHQHGKCVNGKNMSRYMCENQNDGKWSIPKTQNHKSHLHRCTFFNTFCVKLTQIFENCTNLLCEDPLWSKSQITKQIYT